MSKFGGGIGAPSKEERLKAAAEIHLRLGQIQRYCELMVELGEVLNILDHLKVYVHLNCSFSSREPWHCSFVAAPRKHFYTFY